MGKRRGWSVIFGRDEGMWRGMKEELGRDRALSLGGEGGTRREAKEGRNARCRVI